MWMFIYSILCDHIRAGFLCCLCFADMTGGSDVPFWVCREQDEGHSSAVSWFGRALPLLGGTRMKSCGGKRGGITLEQIRADGIWAVPEDISLQTISQNISQQMQTVWKMIISTSISSWNTCLHSTYNLEVAS